MTAIYSLSPSGAGPEGVRHIAEDGLVGDPNNTLPPPDGRPNPGGTCQIQTFAR